MRSSHSGGGGRSVQARHHLGPERIPAEGLCRAVFEVPRGQRNDHFSKKHPPGECAQVPHGHLQPPGHQLGRLHLVLQSGTGASAWAPRATLPGRPGLPPAGSAGARADVPRSALLGRVEDQLLDPRLSHGHCSQNRQEAVLTPGTSLRCLAPRPTNLQHAKRRGNSKYWLLQNSWSLLGLPIFPFFCLTRIAVKPVLGRAEFRIH